MIQLHRDMMLVLEVPLDEIGAAASEPFQYVNEWRMMVQSLYEEL